MNQRSHSDLVVSERPLTNPCCAKRDGADDAVRMAFARVRAWRTPPHWSTHDWLDEVRAILQSAAAFADLNYDQDRNVPRRAHIYMRTVAAAWTRYRQEWSYYLHSPNESSAGFEPMVMPFDRTQADETIRHFVCHALDQLSIEDQLLVRQLFWNRTREKRVATMLDVSQQEVSRRKGRVLRLLRQTLNGYGTLLLSQLGSLCLTILDVLDVIDLIPDLDFLLS